MWQRDQKMERAVSNTPQAIAAFGTSGRGIVTTGPAYRTTLRPAIPSGPVACSPRTRISDSARDSEFAYCTSTRFSPRLPDEAGAHGAPAENPFGDVQFPRSWNTSRYALVWKLVTETSTLATSPRSSTRILPETAEPPIGRSTATWPISSALADLGSGPGGVGLPKCTFAQPAASTAPARASAAARRPITPRR